MDNDLMNLPDMNSKRELQRLPAVIDISYYRVRNCLYFATDCDFVGRLTMDEISYYSRVKNPQPHLEKMLKKGDLLGLDLVDLPGGSIVYWESPERHCHPVERSTDGYSR